MKLENTGMERLMQVERQFMTVLVILEELKPGREAIFGVTGLFAAGLDPVEQFVGSFPSAITSDGKTLTYTITNTSSFTSLMYGIAPDWSRSTLGPGGNMTQTYIFTEPINFKK